MSFISSSAQTHLPIHVPAHLIIRMDNPRILSLRTCQLCPAPSLSRGASQRIPLTAEREHQSVYHFSPFPLPLRFCRPLFPHYLHPNLPWIIMFPMSSSFSIKGMELCPATPGMQIVGAWDTDRVCPGLKRSEFQVKLEAFDQRAPRHRFCSVSSCPLPAANRDSSRFHIYTGILSESGPQQAGVRSDGGIQGQTQSWQVHSDEEGLRPGQASHSVRHC